jgi:hypothetical protein
MESHGRGDWCRLQESNPRPTDYKSVALPTELSRRIKDLQLYQADFVKAGPARGRGL